MESKHRQKFKCSALNMLALLLFMIVILVFALIAAKYWYDNRTFYQLAANVPSAKFDRWVDSGLPLVGHAFRFLGTTGDLYDTIKVFAKKTIENGGVMKLWLGHYLYAMVTDASAAEIILTTCLQKDKTYRFANTWAGTGLVTADFHLWKPNRKLFNPAFSARVTDGYLGAINEEWRLLNERLKPLTDKGIVNVDNYVNKAALSALCKTALGGVGFDLQTDEHLPFLAAIQDHTNLIYTRAFRGWMHPEIIFQMSSLGTRERRNVKVLHEFNYKILRTKREELKNHPKSTDTGGDKSKNQIPYLELLLKLCDEDKLISEEQVRAEIDSTLEAGYASTAVSVGLLFTLLGSNPEIQEKLYDELKQFYGDSTRDVEKLDLTHLPYLDCVIKETNRMYPLTSVVLRRTEQDLKISDKITLPAGCGILISPWGLHHDPKVWGEDHETFRPERWEDKEAAAKRHACSYIPFSYGARNCIGKYHAIMQLKVALIHVVRQFKVYADPKAPLTFKLEIFIKQRNGVFVALEKR